MNDAGFPASSQSLSMQVVMFLYSAVQPTILLNFVKNLESVTLWEWYFSEKKENINCESKCGCILFCSFVSILFLRNAKTLIPGGGGNRSPLTN